MVLTPRQIYNYYFSSDKEFVRQITDVTGVIPKEPFLYHLSLTHSSSLNNPDEMQSAMESNERLEYLGDSILDSVIAEHLFKIYPTRDEGFLTEMRSKIVNRKSLNEICKKMGLGELIVHKQGNYANSSMYGDALEAFIGAIYLDLGYRLTKRVIRRKIIIPFLNFNRIEKRIISFKNKLIEHVQKNKLGTVKFDLIGERRGEGSSKIFKVNAMIDSKVVGTGEGKSKKGAEQNASEDALLRMRVIEPSQT